MFDGIDKIDWQKLRVPDAPKWIQGLVSENTAFRDESFDEIRDTYIYERPDFAKYIVPYIIEIIGQNHANADIPLLLEFLKSLRVSIIRFISTDVAMVESQFIKSKIDSSIEIYKKHLSSNNSETRDAAKSLIKDIENS